jgi:hypothetical protein
MKVNTLIFVVIIGSVLCPLYPMSPEPSSLCERFKKICAYSNAYPEKKNVVESWGSELGSIVALLAIIDRGDCLTGEQNASLRGLFEMVISGMNSSVKQNSAEARLRESLLSFEIALVTPLKRDCRQVYMQFYDPDYKEPEDRSCSGSPDLST